MVHVLVLVGRARLSIVAGEQMIMLYRGCGRQSPALYRHGVQRLPDVLHGRTDGHALIRSLTCLGLSSLLFKSPLERGLWEAGRWGEENE
jgi:hypothetical protein